LTQEGGFSTDIWYPSAMPPKIIRIVVWLATTALAILMLAMGGSKLAGDEAMKQVFIDFGWPDPIYFLTGLAEVLAAIGLLVRQVRVAACGLIAFIMAGAAITNIVTGAPEVVSFNLILILTSAALAWHYADLEGLTIKEAFLKTGSLKASTTSD
jgi:uncharacterized membrane protein YphA (DoxX/SURF4 family)